MSRKSASDRTTDRKSTKSTKTPTTTVYLCQDTDRHLLEPDYTDDPLADAPTSSAPETPAPRSTLTTEPPDALTALDPYPQDSLTALSPERRLMALLAHFNDIVTDLGQGLQVVVLSGTAGNLHSITLHGDFHSSIIPDWLAHASHLYDTEPLMHIIKADHFDPNPPDTPQTTSTHQHPGTQKGHPDDGQQ